MRYLKINARLVTEVCLFYVFPTISIWENQKPECMFFSTSDFPLFIMFQYSGFVLSIHKDLCKNKRVTQYWVNKDEGTGALDGSTGIIIPSELSKHRRSMDLVGNAVSTIKYVYKMFTKRLSPNIDFAWKPYWISFLSVCQKSRISRLIKVKYLQTPNQSSAWYSMSI